MGENKGLKIVLIVVAILALGSAVFAVKEYMSYRSLESKFDEYCDTYNKLSDENSEIYSQLEEHGVKIDNKKLNDEY